MIQRIQTIWLLLAVASASTAFFIPFALEYVSNVDTTTVQDIQLNAKNDTLTLILIADIILCALIAIVSYKNRKVQKAFCVIVSLLSVLCIGYMVYTAEFANAPRTLRLGVIAPVLSLVFGILAFNGVRKDDKLVKNLDRLR